MSRSRTLRATKLSSPITRYFLLFVLILVGIYAKYDALEKLKTREGTVGSSGTVLAADVRFMKRAMDLGRRAHADQPFGSVVVLNGEIVGEGAHSVKETNDPSAHAEVIAIRNACVKLSRIDLQHANVYTSAQSCGMCFELMRLVGIERVYYCIREPVKQSKNLLMDGPPQIQLIRISQLDIASEISAHPKP